MNSTQCFQNYTERPKENNRDHTVKNEQDSAIERQLIRNTSINNFHAYTSNTDDIKITRDEMKMSPIHYKVENFVHEMSMGENDMDIQNKGVQTVKKVTLEKEELSLEETENTMGGVAKLKSDYESFDKCERDIKMEAAFYDEENQEVAETAEQNVQILSETEICGDYKIDIVDNLIVGDFVKNKLEEGMR